MRVLVCGGRDYHDREKVFEVISSMRAEKKITMLIAGCASGADALALECADLLRIDHTKFFANWDEQLMSAGPIRNQRMLNVMSPELVVAFPGGKGTADMCERARKAGIKVMEVEP